MGQFQNFTVVAGQAVIIFGFIKMSFGIFGWLSQDAVDNQMRKGIDLGWDYLNRLDFDEKISSLILSMLGVINSNFNRIKINKIVGYFLLILAANSVILFNFLFSISASIDGENIFDVLFHAFLLSVLNILCLFIVYSQTLILPKKLNLFFMFLKAFLCLCVVCCILFFSATFFYDSIYNDFELVRLVNDAAKEQSDNAFFATLNAITFALIVGVLSVLLCLSQAIPLLIFMFILALGALLCVFPRLLIHSLFLVSTDKKPIFNQLGSFFGFLAGLLVLLINWFAKYS